MPSKSGVVAALVMTALAGCVIGRRPLRLPAGDAPAVLLLSGPLAEPISNVARHSWLAVRGPGEKEWQRWEIWGSGNGQGDAGFVQNRARDPLEWNVAGHAALHSVWRGAKATRAIACIRKIAPGYPDRHFYRAWPGPNSNTFVDWLLRRCELDAELPATAVGKDWRGWVGGSMNAGQTGFQLESPIVGVKLGFSEGVQLHLFTFAIGIDWWPPALIVPFGEGRIGFADRD